MAEQIGVHLEKTKIDLFLQYPAQRDRFKRAKYLDVPRPYHIKHGLFIVPPTTDKWSIVMPVDPKDLGLAFIDKDGKYHPFMRDARWRKKGFADPKWLDVSAYKLEYLEESYYEDLFGQRTLKQ